MPAADNYVSNNDAVIAVVPEEQTSDNAVLIKPFDNSFFEAANPENPSKKLPRGFLLCYRCKCSMEQRLKYGDNLSMQGQLRSRRRIWISLSSLLSQDFGGRSQRRLVVAHDRAGEQVVNLLATHGGNMTQPAPNLISIREFERMGVCQNFLRKDTTLRGLDQDVCALSSLWGNERTYVANNRRFQQVQKKPKDELKPAVVLDMFGGIGGGIVALKRLGIAVHKVQRLLLWHVLFDGAHSRASHGIVGDPRRS
jgi:hypothetical protein